MISFTLNHRLFIRSDLTLLNRSLKFSNFNVTILDYRAAGYRAAVLTTTTCQSQYTLLYGLSHAKLGGNSSDCWSVERSQIYKHTHIDFIQRNVRLPRIDIPPQHFPEADSLFKHLCTLYPPFHSAFGFVSPINSLKVLYTTLKALWKQQLTIDWIN